MITTSATSKKLRKKKTLLGPCPCNGNIFRMHDPWLQNMPFQSGNGFHFAIPLTVQNLVHGLNNVTSCNE
jgi:hypothetical protein